MLFLVGLDKTQRRSHQGAIQHWCPKAGPFSPLSPHHDFEDTLDFLALMPLNTIVSHGWGWTKPSQRLENSTTFFFSYGTLIKCKQLL